MIDPLYGFVFLGLFSPGPNVILLTNSGARFGFLPTLPHLLGVALGVGIIAAATGLGIAAMLATSPKLEFGLRLAAALWILVMAARLWRAKPSKTDAADRPMNFIEAVLFQWVNPKIWAVALAAASAYPGGISPIQEAGRLALAFSSVNFFVCLFWVCAGTFLAFLMKTPMAWLVFNRVMAVMLGAFSVLLFA
jgi:threonine/homoserine/homoserine lactone efflux protein